MSASDSACKNLKILPFADELNTLVCRASRGTQANLGLMAYRTYMKIAIILSREAVEPSLDFT